MDKIDNLKDIILRLNLQICNLVQYADKNLVDKLVDAIIAKFNSYSDDNEKYFPLVIDARALQKASISIDERVIKYAEKNGIPVSEKNYQLLELQKQAANIQDLDELRMFRKKISTLENDTKDMRVRDIKNLILVEYLVNLFPYMLFTNYNYLKCLISSDDLEAIKKKLDFIVGTSIDLLSLFEMETIFYDCELFYKFLSRCIDGYRIIVPTIIVNGEAIVDYDLQENINFYMLNQRSGVFTMNFITRDTIYHSGFQNWRLQEAHDIIITNVKSRGY